MIENIKDCEYVISHGMGQRIYDDLTQNNIKAIVTDEETVDNASEKFLKNEIVNRIDKLH